MATTGEQPSVEIPLDGHARRGQDALFEGDFAPLPEDIGFRGPVASGAAGISYRQLDYWARTGLVRPEIRAARGSGSQRLYSFRDILMLKVVKRLLDAGVSLQQIRVAIDHLRSNGAEDLSRVTLMSDGVSVYECTNDNEVIDLLHGGQGMFAIALGGCGATFREVLPNCLASVSIRSWTLSSTSSLHAESPSTPPDYVVIEGEMISLGFLLTIGERASRASSMR